MALVRTRRPDGGAWTLREWVQGKPIGHPTHALLVHYPVAFALGVVLLDAVARAGGGEAGFVRAAAVLGIAGAAAGLAAGAVGLVDWAGMVRGSRKRRVATTHLLIQASAWAASIVVAAVHWSERARTAPSWGALVIATTTTVAMLVGNWFGGELVYRLGMRVSTGGLRD